MGKESPDTGETVQAGIDNGGAVLRENEDYTAADKLRECALNARLRGDFRRARDEE